MITENMTTEALTRFNDKLYAKPGAKPKSYGVPQLLAMMGGPKGMR